MLCNANEDASKGEVSLRSRLTRSLLQVRQDLVQLAHEPVAQSLVLRQLLARLLSAERSWNTYGGQVRGAFVKVYLLKECLMQLAHLHAHVFRLATCCCVERVSGLYRRSMGGHTHEHLLTTVKRGARRLTSVLGP